MNAKRNFQISVETAAILSEMTSPWFKVSGETLIGPFNSRADARAFPRSGTAVKASDLILVIVPKDGSVAGIDAAPVEPIAEVVVEPEQVAEVEVVAEAAPVEVKVEPVAEIEVEPAQVVIRKSAAIKPCTLVWNIADEMPNAKRKDVIAAAIAAGVATYTARTQYQLWFATKKEMQAREEAQAQAAKNK